MKPGQRKSTVDNSPAARPPDLKAVKAAIKHHSATRYGKPVAARLLPAELDNLNLLRAVLPPDVAPDAYRMKDGGVLKACFNFTCGILLGKKAKVPPKNKDARRYENRGKR